MGVAVVPGRLVHVSGNAREAVGCLMQGVEERTSVGHRESLSFERSLSVIDEDSITDRERSQSLIE
ncbi:hypothetical protein GCM10027569_76700 [Flindersiella endophytica]